MKLRSSFACLLFISLWLSGCGASNQPTHQPTSTPSPETPTQALKTHSAATPTPSPFIATTGVIVTPALSASLAPNYRYVCQLDGVEAPVYTYRLIHTYPHDPNAYTQGLIFRQNALYESTGLRGQSSLRQTILETGEITQRIEIPQPYFAEGLTELGGKLYQLTWQEQTGYIYDLKSFQETGTFSYPTEGWGLTEDGRRLIMSDGSERLYILDPATLQAIASLSVQDERGPVYRINELEYIEGEIWANIYQTACIARIDPQTGQVLGWIDITGLHDPVDHPGAEVPNGIAYDPIGKRIFVTGKWWDSLYEIKVIPLENSHP